MRSQEKARRAVEARGPQPLALGAVGEQRRELGREGGRVLDEARRAAAGLGQRAGGGRRPRACPQPSPRAPAGRSPRRATAARTPPRRRRGPGSSASSTWPSSRSASRPCSAANCGRWPPATASSTPSAASARAAGTSAPRFLRAVWEATQSTYGPLEPERAARGLRVRAGREARVDAARHHGDPRRVDARAARASSPRENSETVTIRRARAASTAAAAAARPRRRREYQPGWRSDAASWSTSTVRRDAAGARLAGHSSSGARIRAHPGRQHELLPRVARAVHERAAAGAGPRTRPVAARAAARTARAPSARRRPARGARRRVRRWRSAGSAAGLSQSRCARAVRGATLRGTCGLIRSMAPTGDPR